MFKTRKYYTLPINLELSDCMYKTKPFYTLPDDLSMRIDDEEVKINGDSKELNKICQRQQTVLKQLEQLKCRIQNLSTIKVSQSLKETAVEEKRISLNTCINDLQEKLAGIGSSGESADIVIIANPNAPPYSVFYMIKRLQSLGSSLCLRYSFHSSVVQNNYDVFSNYVPEEIFKSGAKLSFLIQWKNVSQPCMKVSSVKKSGIFGETSIIRYIARLFPSSHPFYYESGSVEKISETDSWLDFVEKSLNGDTNAKKSLLKHFNPSMLSSEWLEKESTGITDIYKWSVLLQRKIPNLPANIEKEFSKLLVRSISC